MKQKFLLTVALVAALLTLSACGGAEATPEISPEDLASTAMAQAWQIVTLTAAAAPTATPVPPTFTPQPTNTAAPTLALLPTLPPATPIVAATATTSCEQIPQPKPKGALTNVEIYNESGGVANFSFGMNFANEHGECFTYTYTLGPNRTLSVPAVVGCYWGWAYIDAAEDSNARTGDILLCMTDPNLVYRIKITAETINFK